MPEEKKATGSKSSVVKKLKATAAAGAYQTTKGFNIQPGSPYRNSGSLI